MAGNAPIVIARAMPHDLAGVRNLQEKNHKENLPRERWAEGYISLRTYLPLLGRIREETGIVIAKGCGGVVGYELPLDASHRLEAKGDADVIVPTFLEIGYCGRKIADYNWVTGQYCVDEPFRGTGIPTKMHPEFLEMLGGKFDLLVFIVSKINLRSLHVALNKLGMVEAADRAGRAWKTLVQEIG